MMEYAARTLGVLGITAVVFILGTWGLNLLSAPSTARVYAGACILAILISALVGAVLHFKVLQRLHDWFIVPPPDDEAGEPTKDSPEEGGGKEGTE